ncbi:MAG: cysteine--tRNA ligase [Deltaproteobacteria bacterium RIFCSPLOWO2_02_FULL_44_10]|nr:MAG: cysteine--tRNA ligase [Deltaproteobacteria bacterium RIFCSPHIGHO2_02_FULL_44_16]OGQ45500.1 MAG: cysteine--tRNA ligase [Deltaproteobacteria bacterium RIFCSPLOWO2_02_FULL_44_10]
MTLKIHNTLHRKKEEFIPLKKGKVGIYACGVTVYDSSHIGHGRAALTYDVVVRYLRYLDYEVTFVRNYTDVDDKIILRANKEGVSADDIAQRYIDEYERDMKALGIDTETKKPKATKHIKEMTAMIETLIKKKMAYAVESNVFFSVRAFPSYGKLSNRNIEELESGARVEIDEQKRDPLDFALWKKAKPGEPSWKSPWGEGRPGWHIECSAMSTKYLGETFDIHGGGRDLIFPHHENEIAQSEGAHGKEFARYWMHNGLITLNDQKMSKSLGNVANISELLKRYHPEVLRLFMFSNHYRSPLDYSEQAMSEAKTALDRFYETVSRVSSAGADEDHRSCPLSNSTHQSKLLERLSSFENDFQSAMNDDFNTAAVVGNVFEIVRLTNKMLDENESRGERRSPGRVPHAPTELIDGFHQMQKLLGNVLGFFGSDPKKYREQSDVLAMTQLHIDPKEIERLLEERRLARHQKNFQRSDEIRDQLQKMGVELKDRPNGTTEWKTQG